jgi:hypothetical protein
MALSQSRGGVSGMRKYAAITDVNLSDQALDGALPDYKDNLLNVYQDGYWTNSGRVVIFDKNTFNYFFVAILIYFAIVKSNILGPIIVNILALPIFFAIATVIHAWMRRSFTYRIAVMKDGIIFQEFALIPLIPLKPFTELKNYCYDWNDIEIIDFRGRYTTLKTIGSDAPFIPLRKRNNIVIPSHQIAESLFIHQQRGIIPHNVVIFQPQAASQSQRAKRGFFARLQTAVFWVFVLAAIVVGYPLYVGGGSLLQAVIPKIADIAPDAADRAISRHPDWPLSTKLKLRAITTSTHAAPLNFLMDVLGLRQNSLEYLKIVPLFWVMQFTSRETQVDWLAQVISGLEAGPDHEGAHP